LLLVAGRIRDEDVKAVRDASPVAEIVGERVQLRSAGGGNLKGLCPFHEDSTPSFNVTPVRGLYHCFGCGEGGDVISFVMKMDHLSFNESVEQLAKRARIELRYAEGGYTKRVETSERVRLLEAHKAAADFYQEQLATPAARHGRELLAGRGFDQAGIDRFSVGYAPAGWDTLIRHLRGRGFTDHELLAGGLASQGRRGAIDRFRDRLIWPIVEPGGEVIGFGARRLNDDKESPKYLNTPETPLYKKSSVLYGLDLARRDIAAQGRAVVVEGYTDVMACHLAGQTTAIATCGTAFGEEHIKILRRLVGDRNQYLGCEVVFTFDGDAAGQKAALRAFQEDQRWVTQTFVAVQPDGMDPCDLRMARGDAAIGDLISSRVPLFEFAIKTTVAGFDVDTAEGRVAALRSAAPVIARIRDQALQPEYARRLAGWLGMDDQTVVSEVRRALAAQRRAHESHGNDSGGRGQGDSGRQGSGRQDSGRQDAGRQDSGRQDYGRSGAARVPAQQNGPGRDDRGAGPESAQGAPARPWIDLRDPAGRRQREALKLALQYPKLAGHFDGLEADEFTHAGYAAVREAIVAAGGAGAAQDPLRWLSEVSEAAVNDVVRTLINQLAVEPPILREAVRGRDPVDAAYVAKVITGVRVDSVARHEAQLHSQLQRVDPRRDPEQHQAIFAELNALVQYRKRMTDLA
jgi:DNA primase